MASDGLFNGQYCLLEFSVPDSVFTRTEQCAGGNGRVEEEHSLEVVLGICLPANCQLQETRELLECEGIFVWEQ